MEFWNNFKAMVTLRTCSTESVIMLINNTPKIFPYMSPSFNSSKLLATFLLLDCRWLNVNWEQSLNFNRQKYIHSLKDEGLLLKITVGKKVLKCHSFSLNTENNFISITETVFCLLFRHFWKKKKANLEINKIFKDCKSYRVLYHCCNTYFFPYLLSNTQKFCSLTWLIHKHS